MASSLKQFEKELNEDLEKIFDAVEQIEKDVTLEIFNALLEPKEVGGTPKKTGHLRSNYIISIDSKYDGVVGTPESVDKSKREQSKNNFKSKENLIETNNIYINNNVDYASVVNSYQRFREGSIQRGLDKLKKERIIK